MPASFAFLEQTLLKSLHVSRANVKLCSAAAACACVCLKQIVTTLISDFVAVTTLACCYLIRMKQQRQHKWHQDMCFCKCSRQMTTCFILSNSLQRCACGRPRDFVISTPMHNTSRHSIHKLAHMGGLKKLHGTAHASQLVRR